MFVASSRRYRALAIAGALTFAAACSDRRTAERADSDLSHDLALAGQMNAQPALKDTAVANAPQPAPNQPPAQAPRADVQSPRREPVQAPTQTATLPASAQTANTPVTQKPDSSAMAAATPPGAASAGAAAPAPAPEPMVIAGGTGIALNTGMRVCTNTNKVGDKLVATVTNPVSGSGGASIPTGARVVLELANVTPGGSTDNSTIVFRPTTMYINGNSYPVSGAVTSTTPLQKVDVPSTGATDKEKVAGGAVVGAILGQLFGHSTKSTVIGAAAGAATGAVVAKAQTAYQACLPEGASLVLTLDSAITMN